MRPIRSAPVFALLVAACQSNARTPPATDESPSVSAPAATAVDTGTSAPTGAPAAPIASSDDGQHVTVLARLPGPQPTDSQEALLEGTLVAQAGCLWVVSPEGSRYAVLWPPHVELAPGTRPARITDSQSGASAQVGGRIRVGGGEVPGTPALAGSLPGGCQDPFWLATGIVAPAG